MIDRRKPKLRRRGEENGPIDWRGVRSLIVDLLLVVALMAGGIWAGAHYEKTKDNGLKEVPATEYTVKGKVKK